MKLKKRKKSSRLRGSRTAGHGFRQKPKGGKGNKGGKGMSGSGKRADQKAQKALMIARERFGKNAQYFEKQGLTSRSTEKRKNRVLNLEDIKNNLFKNGKEENKIDLNGYKILGKGDGLKVEIIASQASKTAIDKMQKAGGKIILPEKPVVGKEIKKEESGKDEKEKQKKEEK